jgi:glycosyltransferase involved in cell wall biosynthesis
LTSPFRIKTDELFAMTAVSIAMATYNGERHIRRQLDSLAAQTAVPSELVVTDDCSRDTTLEVIDVFAKTAPFPVRVYRNETRLGYRANFMRAASLCRSDLIAFCDQDDYWYPSKIDKATAPFQNPDVLLTHHDADVVAEDGTHMGTLGKIREAPSHSSPWFWALGFTQVFRHSLLELPVSWELSQDPLEGTERAAHDVWFFFLARVFGEAVFVNARLVAHVQHGSNTYGIQKRAGKGRVSRILRDRRPEIRNFAEVARNQADLLREAAEKVKAGQWQHRLATQAQFYQKLATVYDERYKTHSSANPLERLACVYRLLKDTHYADTWGLERKTSMVDLLAAILGPKSSSR